MMTNDSGSNKYYFYVVAILVSMNLLALGALWFLHFNKKEPVAVAQMPRPGELEPGRGGDVRIFFVRELDFSRSQADEFRVLADEHHERSKAIDEAILLLKQVVTQEALKDSPVTEKIERLVKEIGLKEAEKERERMRHFQELSNLCRPEQRVKLRALFKEVLESNRVQQRSVRPGERRPPPRFRDGERRPQGGRPGEHQPPPRRDHDSNGYTDR